MLARGTGVASAWRLRSLAIAIQIAIAMVEEAGE
jgi:hypothetical protein